MSKSSTKPCTKRGYTEIDAKMALAKIQWRDNTSRGKTECRYYKCPACKAYHLTSRKQFK